MRGVKETAADSPLTQALSRCYQRIDKDKARGIITAEEQMRLREMLSPDGVTKARKAALERLRSRYPGSGLHLWRDVYHALKDI